jgi:hypothetical protein
MARRLELRVPNHLTDIDAQECGGRVGNIAQLIERCLGRPSVLLAVEEPERALRRPSRGSSNRPHLPAQA